MARHATLEVRIKDLPEVEALAERTRELEALAKSWEQRVRCVQCGKRYTERACGPTHATVHALVYPEHFGGG